MTHFALAIEAVKTIEQNHFEKLRLDIEQELLKWRALGKGAQLVLLG